MERDTNQDSTLARRERQIMDIVYAHGEASAAQIVKQLPDPPTRGALTVMLRILERKGHLTHTKKGLEFIYRPAVSRKRIGRSALKRVVNTFFGGSIRDALAAHLAGKGSPVSPQELAELADLIRQARDKGK